MPNLTFASLRGTRTAIHCSTKSEAERVDKICGYSHCASAWHVYGENFALNLSSQGWEKVEYFKNNNYAIIPAADFIAANSGEAEPPKSELTENQLTAIGQIKAEASKMTKG